MNPLGHTAGQASKLRRAAARRCLGTLDYCKATAEASLPKDGPFADLVLNLTHNSLVQADYVEYEQAAVNDIGWAIPNGYTPLDAMASPRAWDIERSYYKCGPRGGMGSKGPRGRQRGAAAAGRPGRAPAWRGGLHAATERGRLPLTLPSTPPTRLAGRYKSVLLLKPLPAEGIQAVLDYASGGVKGSRVFDFQVRAAAAGRAAAHAPPCLALGRWGAEALGPASLFPATTPGPHSTLTDTGAGALRRWGRHHSSPLPHPALTRRSLTPTPAARSR